MTDAPYKDLMILDKEPVKVTNRISGQSIMLSPVEVAVYDTMMGAYRLGMYKEFDKGKYWFVKNNPEAYYTLID